MGYTLQLVTGPAIEPVDIEAVKLRCRQVDDNWTLYLEPMIAEERARAERVTGIRLLTQTLRLVLDAFPADEYDAIFDGDTIRLPGPVQSITSVVYIDTAGVSTTLASTLYQLAADGPVGRLSPAYGETWPAVREQNGAVRITYQAGCATAAEVPEEIKAAILNAIMFRFDGERDEAFLDGLFASQFCGNY